MGQNLPGKAFLQYEQAGVFWASNFPQKPAGLAHEKQSHINNDNTSVENNNNIRASAGRNIGLKRFSH